MKPLISILTLIAGTSFATMSSADHPVCMSADEMKAALIDWYGEEPVAEPSSDKEQVWASKSTGTWTMIKTYSDGSACVLAKGDDWMSGIEDGQLLAELK